MTKLNTIPIMEFKTAETFETWLVKNHDNSNGLWIKINYPNLAFNYIPIWIDIAIPTGTYNLYPKET
jgi:hypothetical protein